MDDLLHAAAVLSMRPVDDPATTRRIARAGGGRS
jgi:hypothetical protein